MYKRYFELWQREIPLEMLDLQCVATFHGKVSNVCIIQRIQSKLATVSCDINLSSFLKNHSRRLVMN
jgi:hypothetical protein